MSGFFVGRDAVLLTYGPENQGLCVRRIDLEASEFGHMACRIEDAMQFLYVYGGTMVCQINQETQELRPGEGFFINSGNAYRFTGSGKGGCEFSLISMDPSYIGGTQDSLIMEKYVNPLKGSADFPWMKLERSYTPQEEILEFLRGIVETASAKDTGYELELRSLTERVWVRLYREFCRLCPKRTRPQQKEAEKLRTMLGYLHDNYREKITLSAMAEFAGVSSGEYCRFFKKHMRQTPFEYLQTYRIEQSVPELVGKLGKITEIALHHGFTGSSYYAETFKKEMGCAPGDYRKWYRREIDGHCPLSCKGQIQPKEEVRQAPRRQESMPAHLL